MTAVKEGFIPKTHVSLNVKDIERSVAFYEGFFGVAAHKRRPGYANFNLVSPPLKLALQEVPYEQGAGTLSHLGVQMATQEEVEAARTRLITSGLATFDEGDTVCCYARQNKIWAHDPDGNAWEVYVLLDEMNNEADDHFHIGGTAEGSACCSGGGCATTAVKATILSPLSILSAKAGEGKSCCGSSCDC